VHYEALARCDFGPDYAPFNAISEPVHVDAILRARC
jgi:hypothetical protein